MSAPRPIEILPEHLANQIAAGEVVERPASVVKELCENAIDAGATRVEVAIEGGGVGLVAVTDDGAGMSADDLGKSVLRHATSKLRNLDELMRLGTFGFRGEALPSIASVSRLRIETRRAGDAGGHALELDGPDPARIEPFGAPVGTRVLVRDLFHNVPARRKFLRALATESAHVAEVVEAVALAHPHVTVRLLRDGRTAREYLRAAGRAERVRDVVGELELRRVEGRRGPIAIEALLSGIDDARLGATGLRLFVNGRPVKDRTLARAVAIAYGPELEPGRFPRGAVYLELPPELVDVNVHPQKTEVRFAESRAVLDAIQNVVRAELEGGPFARVGLTTAPVNERGPVDPKRDALRAERLEGGTAWMGSGALSREAVARLAPRARPEPAQTFEPRGATAPLPFDAPAGAAPAAFDTEDPLDRLPPLPARSIAAEPPGASIAASTTEAATRGTATMPAREAPRAIGRTLGGLWLAETRDAVVVIDPRAALERALAAELASGPPAAARLKRPELVEVGAQAVARVEAAVALCASLGLELRPAGPTTVAAHAIPAALAAYAGPLPLVAETIATLARTASVEPAARRAMLAEALAAAAVAEPAPLDDAAVVRAFAAITADELLHAPARSAVVARLPLRELLARARRR
jgi:DNA mismatch repair protein MutL